MGVIWYPFNFFDFTSDTFSLFSAWFSFLWPISDKPVPCQCCPWWSSTYRGATRYHWIPCYFQYSPQETTKTSEHVAHRSSECILTSTAKNAKGIHHSISLWPVSLHISFLSVQWKQMWSFVFDLNAVLVD